MNRDKVMTASGISLIAGLWLMLSAFMFGLTGGVFNSVFYVGLLVGLFSLIRLFAAETTGWLSWLNTILGIWLLISPLFLAGMVMSSIWNSVILGIIVIAMGVWSGSESTMGHGSASHPKMG